MLVQEEEVSMAALVWNQSLVEGTPLLVGDGQQLL